MKSAIDAILQPEQARYLESIVPPRDAVAVAIEEDAHQHSVPIVDPEVGLFLHIAARAVQASRILEIGTATGYSGLWLAQALPPDGLLVTIDINADRQRYARERWRDAAVSDQVETICGAALEVLPTLKGPFDLLFIDAIKAEYRAYLELALPLLRPGALIIADNVLWKGLVARGADNEDTQALSDFNRYAMQHPQLRSVILPLGDGLLYATLLA